MLWKKRINEKLFLDFGNLLCFVLFDTGHLFPETAIDFCSFLVVNRRRTSVFLMCAVSCIFKDTFGLDLFRTVEYFFSYGNKNLQRYVLKS